MTDQISIMLGLFANYSNFYSVLSVLVCFCAMVVFILRLNGDNLMGSSATHYNVVQEQKMVSLHNPFSVQLQGTITSSLSAGIHIDMSVTRPTIASIFWGVNVQAFQKELKKTTQDIAVDLKEKRLFEQKYIHMTDIGSVNPEDLLYQINEKCPESVTEAALGAPPRQTYPVVLVSLLSDWDGSPEYTGIVVQITVFHLKDSICTLDSHIVYQFVKTNHDRVLSLQPIFVVSSDLDTPNPQHHPQPSQSTDRKSNIQQGSEENSTIKENVVSQTPSSNLSSSTELQNARKRDCDICKQTDCVCDKSAHQSTDGSACNCATGVSDESNASQNEAGNVEDVDSEVMDGDDISLNESNSCIVCQSAMIFYTLLPCRHACVCGSCIKQLDRCPMCRAYIDTYFRLHDTNYSSIFPESTDDYHQVPSLSRWQAFNQRLNEYLGFS